jgi:ATP-binding cassette, subfamily C, bacterial
VSGTLLSILDVPFAPLFILVIYLIHPHLGMIVVMTALALVVIALINQKITERPFAAANLAQAKANQHLDSMSRNSQIINALAMIPEAVSMWGRDTAASLIAQVRAQDRNIVSASISRGIRLLTQVAMLGWGAYLAIDGEITGGMVIAASIIAGRALARSRGRSRAGTRCCCPAPPMAGLPACWAVRACSSSDCACRGPRGGWTWNVCSTCRAEPSRSC